MSDVVVEPVLRVTDAALSKITELKAAEDDPEGVGLRVGVTGGHNGEVTHELSVEPLAEAAEDDRVYSQGDLQVIVPGASIDDLDGATLDLPATAGQGGLVIRNPNHPDPLAGHNLDLTGSVAEKVGQLLEQQVNPALDAHGGFATLVGVEDESKVFLSMGGGCQGCAVSAMTLRQGIERAIKDNVPEVTDVIDVTDHDAGENPFYSDDAAAESPYA